MKLIYYTLYRWSFLFEFSGAQAYWAMSFLAIFVNFNVVTLLELINKISGNSTSISEIGIIGIVLICAIVISVLYLMFVKNKKYLEIEKEFEKKGKQILKGNIITLLYLIFSFVSPFGLAFL